MKKTTIHCDMCKRKLNYINVDGDEHAAGFTFEGALAGTSVSVYNLLPTVCGSSSYPTPNLYIPENICSTACMQALMKGWLDSLPIIAAVDIEEYNRG